MSIEYLAREHRLRLAVVEVCLTLTGAYAPVQVPFLSDRGGCLTLGPAPGCHAGTGNARGGQGSAVLAMWAVGGHCGGEISAIAQAQEGILAGAPAHLPSKTALLRAFPMIRALEAPNTKLTLCVCSTKSDLRKGKGCNGGAACLCRRQ